MGTLAETRRTIFHSEIILSTILVLKHPFNEVALDGNLFSHLDNIKGDSSLSILQSRSRDYRGPVPHSQPFLILCTGGFIWGGTVYTVSSGPWRGWAWWPTLPPKEPCLLMGTSHTGSFLPGLSSHPLVFVGIGCQWRTGPEFSLLRHPNSDTCGLWMHILGITD